MRNLPYVCTRRGRDKEWNKEGRIVLDVHGLDSGVARVKYRVQMICHAGRRRSKKAWRCERSFNQFWGKIRSKKGLGAECRYIQHGVDKCINGVRRGDMRIRKSECTCRSC